MSHTWVPYKDGSAVQEAIAVVKALEGQGRTMIYMHQGAEETSPSGILEQYMSYAGHNTPAYGPAKGMPEAREAFAGFARHFLGLPATAANTFILPTNGRVELGHAFKFANRQIILDGGKASTVVPRLRWPMVDNKADQEYTRTLHNYEMTRGELVQEIKKTLAKGEEVSDELITSLYLNLPHNPTGIRSNAEEVAELIEVVDEINRDRASRGKSPITLIDDGPYFANLEQKENGAVLAYPFEGIKMDGDTPSWHIISLSKALGTASSGLTGVVITNTEVAKAYEKFIASDVGPSFDKQNMANIAELFQPKNYPALREHFQKLNDKYTRNFDAVKQNLGEYLVDGDPGMVCTIHVPEDALGKLIETVDGVREILTARDVAAYIANQYGVMVVDQSVGEEPYLRLALKAENVADIEKGTELISQAYKDLQAAPAAPKP